MPTEHLLSALPAFGKPAEPAHAAYLSAHFVHHDGPAPWVLLFPVIWVAALWGAAWLWRRTAASRGHGPGGRQHPDSPLEVLGRRYAAGEIDAAEYRERRAVLSEEPRDAG